MSSSFSKFERLTISSDTVLKGSGLISVYYAILYDSNKNIVITALSNYDSELVPFIDGMIISRQNSYDTAYAKIWYF